MLIPNLPGHSRVWIFASNKLLSEAEIQDVSMLMNSFTAQWQSHGTQLIAACSIDKVFRLLNQTNIDFFQRTLVWIPFCNSAKIITQEQAILQYKHGDLNQESLVVNTLVDTLDQAREQLYIPLKDSWIAQKITRYNQYEG
jgi:hypothetical protein